MASPDLYETAYLICDCGRVACQRCGQRGCVACGGVMHPPSETEAQDLYRRLTEALPGPGPLRRLIDWVRGR